MVQFMAVLVFPVLDLAVTASLATCATAVPLAVLATAASAIHITKERNGKLPK